MEDGWDGQTRKKDNRDRKDVKDSRDEGTREIGSGISWMVDDF